MRERRASVFGVVASIWLIGAGAWARPTLLADHRPGMAPSLSELELGVFSRSDADLYLPTVGSDTRSTTRWRESYIGRSRC